MAGTNNKAPALLPMLAHATATDLRRENQWFNIVIMGIQLPSPCPNDITMYAK
jgi:hypothetical protein